MDKPKHPKSIALVLPLVMIVIISACSHYESLEPVFGAEGQLTITNAWPDSIHGVTLVAMSQLDLESPADYFVDYSDILPAGQDTLHYFIQLSTGSYSLVPVGLTIEPALLIANLDSILSLPSIPIVFFPDMNSASGFVYQTVAFGRASEPVVKDISPFVLSF